MTFQRIDADTEDLGILGAKLVRHLTEPSHFGGADECKISGIEEKDQPFSRKRLNREIRDRSLGEFPLR
jgi:hypothetical protein